MMSWWHQSVFQITYYHSFFVWLYPSLDFYFLCATVLLFLSSDVLAVPHGNAANLTQGSSSIPRRISWNNHRQTVEVGDAAVKMQKSFGGTITSMRDSIRRFRTGMFFQHHVGRICSPSSDCDDTTKRQPGLASAKNCIFQTASCRRHAKNWTRSKLPANSLLRLAKNAVQAKNHFKIH